MHDTTIARLTTPLHIMNSNKGIIATEITVYKNSTDFIKNNNYIPQFTHGQLRLQQ